MLCSLFRLLRHCTLAVVVEGLLSLRFAVKPRGPWYQLTVTGVHFAGARTFKYANIEAQWLRLSPGHQHAWFNMDIIHFIPEIYSVMWALAFPYINNRVTTYFLTFTGLACKFLDQSFKWRCISLPAICRYIRYLLNGARKVEVCIIISANTLGKRGQLGICWIFACLCVLRIN